jgi:hypothetical protein
MIFKDIYNHLANLTPLLSRLIISTVKMSSWSANQNDGYTKNIINF